MNLYWRLILLLINAVRAKRIQVFATSQRQFRALPTDCDLNLHITNSRYLSFMDLGRTYLIGQLGLLPRLFQRRWGPIIQAVELTYFKPIMLGKVFTLTTKIICWDEKYLYLEQIFIINDAVYAKATVKGLFVGRQGKIPTKTIVDLLNPAIVSPPSPAYIVAWQAMLAQKKVK